MIRSITRTLTEPLGRRDLKRQQYATANGNAYKNTGSGWQSAAAPILICARLGKQQRVFRRPAHSDSSSAFSGWGSHSADSVAVAGVHARPVRAAGAAAAAAADGAARWRWPLVVVGGGSERA